MTSNTDKIPEHTAEDQGKMHKLWSMFRPHKHKGSASIAHANKKDGEQVVNVTTTSQRNSMVIPSDMHMATDVAGPRDSPNSVTATETAQYASPSDDVADFMIEYEDAEDDSPPPAQVSSQPLQTRLGKPQQEGAVPYSYTESAPYSLTEDIAAIDYVPNLEAGSTSPRRSYLSIYPSTIQIIDPQSTLFVWHATFHPAVGRRFSSIDVQIKFSKPFNPSHTIGTAKPVHIVKFAPRKAYGATSHEQKAITWGFELPISVPAGPASVGITPSTSHETTKNIEHAFTITGSARGSPTRNTAVWTVEENASSERGVPSELQLAVLVAHSGPVEVEVDIAGWTAGGYFPPHHLRPKTSAMGRRKVIDPVRYKGVLEEVGLGEDRVGGVGRLLDEWTGRVEGAMLQFDQEIVRA